jgi:hypothetical protein
MRQVGKGYQSLFVELVSPLPDLLPPINNLSCLQWHEVLKNKLLKNPKPKFPTEHAIE